MFSSDGGKFTFPGYAGGADEWLCAGEFVFEAVPLPVVPLGTGVVVGRVAGTGTWVVAGAVIICSCCCAIGCGCVNGGCVSITGGLPL